MIERTKLRAMVQSRRFFNLSLDIKRGIEHKPGLDPQRGWSCVGSENTAKLFSASSRSSGDVTTCAKTDGKVSSSSSTQTPIESLEKDVQWD